MFFHGQHVLDLRDLAGARFIQILRPWWQVMHQGGQRAWKFRYVRAVILQSAWLQSHQAVLTVAVLEQAAPWTPARAGLSSPVLVLGSDWGSVSPCSWEGHWASGTGLRWEAPGSNETCALAGVGMPLVWAHHCWKGQMLLGQVLCGWKGSSGS